jgi:tRNA(Ile)-lysidine synthase
MTDLYPAFAQQLQALQVQPGHLFVACLGGGADSQSILDLLDRYRQQHPQYRYLAIHLDHQFHPNSADWAQGLVADCQRRDMPLLHEVLQIASGPGVNKESAGRDARYQRLAELVQQQADNSKASCLLGHHRNDQIETVLLQLKRGAGPKGLAAMARQQGWQQIDWLRPLLTVSKQAIYRYAEQRQLFWIEDDTNFDTDIERNFLRHQVVPLLEQRWPHFGESVLRSAALCAEHNALLEQLLADLVTPHINAQQQLFVDTIASWSAARQRAALRYWLQLWQVPMPSYAQLEQLRQQFLHTSNDAKPLYSCRWYRITRGNDRWLTLSAIQAER